MLIKVLLVVLFAVYLGSTYSRWENVVIDVIWKGASLVLKAGCVVNKVGWCSAEDLLIYMKETPFDSFRLKDKFFVESRNYTTRDGHLLPLLVIGPKNPTSSTPLKVLFEIHGGGHVIGDERFIYIANVLLELEPFLVVSPQYRLAPSHPFPYAPHDCFDAFQWLQKHAGEFNGNLEEVYVGGTSAGGNLASALTIQVNEHKANPSPDPNTAVPSIKGLILVVPLLDFQFTGKSYTKFISTPIWNTENGLIARSLYLPDPKDWKNPLASPIYSDKLHLFPPTFISIDSLDPLRDDGYTMMTLLKNKGVQVDFLEIDTYHAGEGMGMLFGGFKSEASLLKSTLLKLINK